MTIVILELIIFCTLVHTLGFRNVVDEKPLHFNNRGWGYYRNIVRYLKLKLYGANMFKNERLDRLSLIFMHMITVYLVSLVFGINTAILWSFSMPCVFVSTWRNGRRYQVGNIVALLMILFKPLGSLLYPLVYFSHIGAIPALFLYMATGYWYLSFACLLMLAVFWKKIFIILKNKLETKPKIFRVWRSQKIVLVFKTLGYFVYKLCVPQRIFMYEKYLQKYGSDTRETKKAFRVDRFLYLGLFVFICSIMCLFFENTRLGSWWFIIFIFPFLNIYTAHQFNNSRYAVTAGIGLFAVLGNLLPLWLCIVYASCLYVYYVYSLEQFRCDIDMYDYHFHYDREIVNPYVIMARHYISTNEIKNAADILRVGLSIYPQDYGFLHLMCLCDKPNAKMYIEKLKSLKDYQTFTSKDKIEILIKKLEKASGLC